MNALQDPEIVDSARRAAETIVAERFGLRASAATEPRLVSSLQQRAAARGVTIDAYVDRLDRDSEEIQALLELLAVQETSFFRDAPHIDALVRQVLPRTRGPVVVWSAGCATGQEPYSIAMALDEAGVRDWWVVASDVSRRAVARTKAGIYRPNELRGLSPARAGRYLERHGDGYRVVGELRDRVTTVHHNLAVDEPPVGRGAANAVFCRNVFIYMRRERVTACLGRIDERLGPRGVLFLGGSETLGRSDPRFRLTRFGDVFAYERVDPAMAVAPLPLPATAPASPVPPVPVVVAVAPLPLPTSDELRREGETSSRRGDHAAAAAAFRKAVYLDADDVAAHLGLGFSLEALGDADAGHRAFVAAQAALDRAGAESLGAVLEGYAADTVRLVLATKVGAHSSVEEGTA